MTATTEAIITCDGGDKCPMDGCWGDGGMRYLYVKEQRKRYVADGWVFRNNKDYCPDCAARLGLANKGEQK